MLSQLFLQPRRPSLRSPPSALELALTSLRNDLFVCSVFRVQHISLLKDHSCLRNANLPCQCPSEHAGAPGRPGRAHASSPSCRFMVLPLTARASLQILLSRCPGVFLSQQDFLCLNWSLTAVYNEVKNEELLSLRFPELCPQLLAEL